MSYSRKRLLEAWRPGCLNEIVHPNSENPNDLIVERVQDCQHIIDKVQILQDEVPDKEFRLIAYLPEWIMDKAFREGWMNDKAAWRAWVNNPDNRKFRVYNKTY